MITDLFVIYVSYLEKVREIVIWSGQWSAVSCCDSESEDEVLIDVSAGLLKKKKTSSSYCFRHWGKIGKK